MIIETVRFVADLMEDATVGLNAKLAAIGLDSTVAGVEDTRPADINDVLNEFDHDLAARRQAPEEAAQDTPYMEVYQATESEGDGWVTANKVDASLPVVVMFVVRDSDTRLANLACGYYIRCAQQVINSAPTGDSANRTRNSIQVMNHTGITMVTPLAEIGTAVVTRGLVVVYQTREMDPT